jgi:putative metalloenzyme radical SAM/SPASM domain maturase
MYPKKLYLEVTTNCNMSCGMCVKHASGSSISNKHLDIAVFKKLLPSLPHIQALVLNGIGEPLLHPDLLWMISKAHEQMADKRASETSDKRASETSDKRASETSEECWIGFQTNGLLLTPSFTEQLLDAGLNRLCISVDSVPEEQKCGISLTHSNNLPASPFSMVNAVRRQKDKSRFQLGAEIVLLRETLPQLPRLIQRLAEEGVDFILVSHLLPYSKDVESQSLFTPYTEEARAIYLKWEKLADKEGINLSDLTTMTWIAAKDEQELRLKQLYKDMMKDALEQGLWVDVKRLGEWDEESIATTKEIFRKAREIAAEHKVELSLPPLAATRDRSCTFIEDDAVLIDVNGTVTPCHQLWHNQTVHIDEPKHFSCKSFGNVLEQDLLEIWRSTPYQKFRQAVQQYDYPFCHSCTLGPCPDITGETEPFINDCFGVEVPCGHCLWGFDAVRCL